MCQPNPPGQACRGRIGWPGARPAQPLGQRRQAPRRGRSPGWWTTRRRGPSSPGHGRPRDLLAALARRRAGGTARPDHCANRTVPYPPAPRHGTGPAPRMSDTTTVPASGDDGIDGLLSGHRWVGPAVRFGFPGSATEHGGAPETYPELAGFVAPTEAMRAVARHAFASVEALVADIALVEEAEAPGDAPARIGPPPPMRGSSPAYAAYPREERGGDAWFRPGSYDDPRPGDNAWRALFHEIGHTMGLKHGHAYDPRFLDLIDAVLPAGRDSHDFSLMPYRSHIGHPTLYGYTNAADSHPQSYMMLDIAALQYLYGADYGTNAGDTVYAFSPETGAMLVDGTAEEPPPVANILFRTVWDGGGFDAYDFSLYGARRELGIDLRPSLWTDVDADSAFQAADLGGGPEGGRARGQVFNALLHEGDPRSLIEKAIGGRGGDPITGNQAGNR